VLANAKSRVNPDAQVSGHKETYENQKHDVVKQKTWTKSGKHISRVFYGKYLLKDVAKV
jgi:hypothetical protein